MSARVTFVDPLAPTPYSGARGALIGLGGTEASLVKVCEALAAAGRRIVVRQSARQTTEDVAGVRYAGFAGRGALPDVQQTIVVVNSFKVALRLARLHPACRVVVWLHVFPGRHNRIYGADLHKAGIEVLCVSAAHAQWVRRFFAPGGLQIGHVYNPIADDLAPDTTPRDLNLLLFASSPHKGLKQVFERFSTLRQRYPDLRLAVADPGYLAWPAGPVPEGVQFLGRLDQPQLQAWMRRALCLFYPQDHFAETFGLVIAEANALGCPALLHRGLGANDEIASDSGQCIDTTSPEAIASRIARWRAGPLGAPHAEIRPELRLSAVSARWDGLLQTTLRRVPAFETLST